MFVYRVEEEKFEKNVRVIGTDAKEQVKSNIINTLW